MPKYDLIIKGGRVLDPSNGLDGVRDLGIASGVVVRVDNELDYADGGEVVEAFGNWVIPGVVDSHVHVSTSWGSGDQSLGYRHMAESGVTTAIDFAGTMPGIIDGVKRRGTGLNVGGLYVLSPEATLSSDDPSTAELTDALAKALAEGSLGFKCMGGHSPLTPEATARAIEVANEALAYVAFHCGTKATGSQIEGLLEVPELIGNGRLHVAHVNAYCRGMTYSASLECREAIGMLERMGNQLVSEVHMAVPNATSGHCQGDEIADRVTRNCLIMGDFTPTRTGLRQAMEAGYSSVISEREDRVVILEGDEAVLEWEAAGTQISVSFPVGVPQSAFELSAARKESGEFVIDAVSTDGGYYPRNFAVERTWAMYKLGALTPLEVVAKLSWNPARMFGLTSKGRLDPGADADITIVDPEIGKANMSFIAGRKIMEDGNVFGSYGTLIVTAAGEEAAKASQLPYQIVNLAESKLYQGYS